MGTDARQDTDGDTSSDVGRPRRGLSRRAVVIAGAGTVVAALVPIGLIVTRAPADAGTLSSRFASLEAALAATEPGGLLEVDQAYTRSTTWTIDKPVTVTFRPAGLIIVTRPDVAAITITSDDVSIADPRLSGTWADRAGAGRGILAAGRPGTPLQRITITGGVMTGFSYGGVTLSQVTGFRVADVIIDSVGYAGIMLLSCVDGDVADNRVSTVTQAGGAVNSYGIAVTRDTDFDLATTPRSARVRVTGNTITGVTKWEGIDTHAGEGIVIDRNVVRQCHVGIAVVPAKAPPETTTADASAETYVFAPLDCVVSNNVVSYTGDGLRASGILVKGAGDTVGSDAERATGRVVGNTVVGMGGGEIDAAVTVYLTRGLEVSGNTLDDSRARAITVYHSNDALTVADNTVVGVDADPDAAGAAKAGTNAPVAVVDVRAGANTVEISGTTYQPSRTSSRDVRGLYAPGSGSTITSTRNDWSETALAVYNRGNALTRVDDGH
ncbi:hypothetical protein ACPEEZ_13330 [Frigoribacterium sp. 2-23]|uniref:hypothetical protein n=1 Tax=Frigoribacterium sp. 2-23 TaxID=3415006 RepID=UPI003C6FDE9F